MNDIRFDRQTEIDVVLLPAGSEDCELVRGWEWILIISLARNFGWKHRGTTLHPRDTMRATWDGAYFPPIGQCIESDDGIALGRVLAATLDDIPDHDATPTEDAARATCSMLEACSGQVKEAIRTIIPMFDGRVVKLLTDAAGLDLVNNGRCPRWTPA